MNRSRPYPPSPLLPGYLRYALGTRSQPDVARAAGISRPGLNRVLTGVTASPAPDTCTRLAGAIDAPLLHVLALAGWLHLGAFDAGLAASMKRDDHYRFGPATARPRPPLAEALDGRGSVGSSECLHALLRRQEGMQGDAERARLLETTVREAAGWVESWAGDQSGTIGDAAGTYADRSWECWRAWEASRGQQAGLLADAADVPLFAEVVRRALWMDDGQGWAHAWLCGLIGEDVAAEAGLAAWVAAYRAKWEAVPPNQRLGRVEALRDAAAAVSGRDWRVGGEEQGEYYLRRTGRGQAVLRINFGGAEPARFDALLRDLEDRLAREFIRGR